MEKEKIYRLAISGFVIFLILSLSGCRTTGSIAIGTPFPGPVYKEAPPPWAPAHGHRAKYHYRYYPHHNVYFDEVRGVYFYLYGGGWRMSASLPATIRITVNDFVTLDMDDDKPYRYHDEVVKRYPPGQVKKGNQGKDNSEKKYQNRTLDKDRNNSQDRNTRGSRELDRDKNRDYKQDLYKDSGDNKSQDKSQSKLRELDKGKAQEKAKATPQGYIKTKTQGQDKNKTQDTGTIKAPEKDRESQDTSKKKSRDKDRDKDDDKDDGKNIISKGGVDRVSLISR